ncbi:hypothetical protein GE09DRAFT_569738 [Coniochaeta sp. 2T2.1]|nr:hypothetical protein GE09DRAFT_569738 [Coniochaeta sp. 2T2.1]
MGSLTASEKLADAVTRPPELSDAEYVRAVLAPPQSSSSPSRTEDEIEADLLAAAQKLGVDVSSTTTTLPAPATRPATPTSDDKHMSSSSTECTTESSTTIVTSPAPAHVRTGSNVSNTSDATLYRPTSGASISISSPERTTTTSPLTRKRSKSLSFSQYEKYLGSVDPTLSQPKFAPPSQAAAAARSPETAPQPGSIISDSTRRSVRFLKRGLTQRLKWRRKTISDTGAPKSCICCREDYYFCADGRRGEEARLETLPCGHVYCRNCLRVMITQSTQDEGKMPPRCCTQPIPGSTIKALLPSREEQQAFLKAVLQFSTPWESRIFCPNALCGEFIPPRPKGDNPKHPFEVVCRACKTSVCVMCKKGGGHRLGQDCPDDWELDAVLRMGERSGWRRCYKCRTLVELVAGCTHMTCRCKAQFCYICGAVWDPVVGCPNYCNGEEELERRRMEEEREREEREAEKKAREEREREEEVEREEADRRTRESEEMRALGGRRRAQMEDFRRFEHKMRWIMWTRHSQKRLGVIERYKDQMEKTRDRHAKTEQHLEDRQIEAEIELRSSLEQSEKSIRIQLKYMEAYCNGPHRGALLPEREVTRKHREQLARQYIIRDGLERRHQSQINVLREKQAKRMEELVERHAAEVAALEERRAEEFEDLGLEFTNEEEALGKVFRERRARMAGRWWIEGQVLRRELEERDGVRYGNLELPIWPSEGAASQDENLLPAVTEEEGVTE